jgi:hypothetical protein
MRAQGVRDLAKHPARFLSESLVGKVQVRRESVRARIAVSSEFRFNFETIEPSTC